MTEKSIATVSFFAGAFGVAVLEAVYLAHGNFQVVDRHPFGLGLMALFGALGAASLIAGILTLIHTLWTEYGGALLSFVSKVFIGVWGIAITAAVAYLGYLKFKGL